MMKKYLGPILMSIGAVIVFACIIGEAEHFMLWISGPIIHLVGAFIVLTHRGRQMISTDARKAE